MNSLKDPLNIFLAIFCLILLVSILGIFKEGFTSSSTQYMGYGNNNVVVTNINGDEIVNIIFTADNGNSAQIIFKDNNYILIIIDEYGTSVEYIYTHTTTSNTDTLPIISSNATFVGTNGGSAKLIKLNNGNYIIKVNMPNGNKIVFVSKMNDTVNNNNQVYSNQNYMSYSNQPQKYNYSNDLPEGIPASKIPPGHEDLYILKSEIVPPVCPACPSPVPCIQNKTDSCAPCPPCSRCPEPSFECKKVPNYSSTNYDIPDAILSPYSTFGS